MIKLKTVFGSRTEINKINKIICLYEDDLDSRKKPAAISTLQKHGVRADRLKALGFSAQKDEIFEHYPGESKTAAGIIILGLGAKIKYVPDNARRAGGILARTISKRKFKTIAIAHLPDMNMNLAPFIEGIVLGGYTFDQFKKEKDDILSLRLLIDNKYRAFKDKIDKALAVAGAACYARDLVNTPANILTPTVYANQASKLAKKYRIRIRIYDPRQLAGMKMGALLGVAKGSDQPPRLISFSYNGGRKGDQPIVLVGKGVTFDSGGISLKPNEGMVDMKNDMAGSAAVVAQMIVLGELKPKINVAGVAPLVENMPSGKAIKPSDVITASDGQTIEVLNTDAEGRLILADALCFAHRFKPKAIVDIATLTGAVKISLGTVAAGILGNDDNLLKRLYDLGQKTAEKTWQLPLWDEYYEQIKSEIADVKNIGGRPAGTITAAAFLSKFVKDISWAHIDIAAMDNQEGSHPYQPKGATGFGVRLLAELLLG
jgi:leucyl aminopeptidase